LALRAFHALTGSTPHHHFMAKGKNRLGRLEIVPRPYTSSPCLVIAITIG